MTFVEAIREAIEEDVSRKAYDLSGWRTYFLTEVDIVPKGTKLTSTDLLAILGPIEGATVASGVEAANAVVGKLLSPSEGGLDITHKDTTAFLAVLIKGKVITAEQVRAVLEFYKTKQKRHQALHLPDPREKAIKQALLEIN